MIPKLKRIVSGTLAVILCVSININPIATIGEAVIDSGIIDTTSNIGRNIVRMISSNIKDVYAAELINPFNQPEPQEPPIAIPTMRQVIEESSAATVDFSEVVNILNDINFNLEYEDGSELDKIRTQTAEIQGYSKDLLEITKKIKEDTGIIVANTDYMIKQLGYDPEATGVKPKNVKESFERVSDQLDNLSHEYRVANIKSINNMFAGALWKPKFSEVPNLTEFCEITGGFANTYSGYWDTSYDTVNESVLPTDKALEELGYDAIIRAEGVIPVAAVHELGEDGDKTSISLALPYGKSIGGSNMNASHEVLVYDSEGNLDITYNDWGQITDSYNVSEFIPTSQLLAYEQITMPSTNITYLDAVTVLYKALGEEIVTLEGLYTRNPDITVESSPLAKNLPGVVDTWEGYDYYVFATRSNPISYDVANDKILVKYDYSYWKKAVTGGFVNYNLRDEPISAVDFCTLAAKMMEAYGEPAFTDDELHTLLQVYGSSYPIQMGDKIAKSWAYLKARGIITDTNFPEVYTDTLSRDQLLDMCARIKNTDLRDTYKNITLAITLDDVVVDNGVYPYYNFSIDAGSNMFLETTIDYTSLSHYTYMFPMTTDGNNSVNLGYGGSGWVFDSLEFNTLVEDAVYNGMIKLDDSTGGHYYYVVQIPKNYEGNAYLRFVDYNDQERDIGTVSAIELNPEYMCGGIFTQYDLVEKEGIKLATLSNVEEGTNWYSFATQPNNMDLIWFGDIVRCNDRDGDNADVATAATVTRAFPTTSEKLTVIWNNLTAPMKVMANTNTNTVPSIKDNWSLNPGVANTSDMNFEGTIDSNGEGLEGYIIDQTYANTSKGKVYYYQDSNIPLNRAIGSKALTYIARAALMSDYNFGSYYNKWVERYGAANFDRSLVDETAISSLLSKAATGSNVGETASSSGIDPYAILNSVKPVEEFDAEYFASLFHVAANGGKTSKQQAGSLNEELKNTQVVNSLRSPATFDDKLSYLFTTDKAGGVSDFKATPIDLDGKFSASASRPGLVKWYSETIANYLKNDLFSSSGMVGLADVNFDTTLESSVLMDRNHQIFISWSEMVKYGLALDIDADGKPTLRDTDGVYEFITNNGVVRVDDVNKIIQIGSQIYSFQYDNTQDAPSLVHSNDSGTEIYFDVRCITGVSNNDGYTLDAGKATASKRIIGTGGYAILCLSASPTNTQSGSMQTEEVNVKPYAELVGSQSYSEQKLRTIILTDYDGKEAADATSSGAIFKYWKDENDNEIKNSIRMTFAQTIPTANWIFVTSDDGSYFGGKLYVFYLRQAFDEGFLDVNGNKITVQPTEAFIRQWEGTLYSTALQNLSSRFPSLQFEKAFNGVYGSLPNKDSWQMKMTKCALANLASDTGVFWSSSDYYVRVFDFTNASAAYNTYQTDFTKNETELDYNTDYDRSNKPGAVYFLDYLGFIYNIPEQKEFDLKRYYTGEYPLPLAYATQTVVVNYNMNYYGNVNEAYNIGGDTSLPLGVELTESGFVRYTNDAKTQIYNNLKADKFTTNKQDGIMNPPFSVGSDVNDGSADTVFTAAPAGVYMRYGLFRDTSYDKKISDISASYTDINDFFIGTRKVTMHSTSSSNSSMRYFVYGSDKYGPIGISAKLHAELCHKYMKNPSRAVTTSAYIINTNNILTPYMMKSGDINTLGMTTPEIDWDGRAKLVSILDAIDNGTNMIMWVALTVAPFLCVIVMTLLIGMSFMTESKIWLAFCDKFFDPVEALTLRARNSHNWNWRKVLIPCIITYISFALLCNGNIIKIIIYVVDAYMRIMNAIN